LKIHFENKKTFSIYGHAVEIECMSGEDDAGVAAEKSSKVPANESCLCDVILIIESHR